uniref:Uncharacterized protein n=1 Tax=Craspedostauros australis TaxID=1486917 RepID=A0A7R9ZKR0_9STRA|mmetsp:Transcript_18511/g.51479  ORF Transcript_18511/g.51479 Transcript_18511/m.51479 type:complete len:188 (+) Transcript_18511:572-1135(+)|eukprot:CAMPEP_0198130658 /NCGR_PEP_ID=MMETSP1442-20131203/54445_1 /TAXON_ID= /ORGANISM="Craspedostauros australis, Strain CCMP3328" /LENGTH=187 /DNA_ID=CAMNT_0043791327 /DNA_START=571 /DNA_END=1134 /DNA_ORIENTATION=+
MAWTQTQQQKHLQQQQQQNHSDPMTTQRQAAHLSNDNASAMEPLAFERDTRTASSLDQYFANLQDCCPPAAPLVLVSDPARSPPSLLRKVPPGHSDSSLLRKSADEPFDRWSAQLLQERSSRRPVPAASRRQQLRRYNSMDAKSDVAPSLPQSKPSPYVQRAALPSMLSQLPYSAQHLPLLFQDTLL